MADPRRGPPVPPKPNIDANGLTAQFEDLLRTRRLNDLADRSQRRTESPEPHCHASLSSRPPSRQAPRAPTEQPNGLPAYSSLRNHPKIATPPQDPASLRFCSQLRALSVRPTKYENPGLLDEALQVIPLDRIYGEAEDESNLLQAEALSLGGKPKWGHQDCVVRALLRYARTFRAMPPSAKTDVWSLGGSREHSSPMSTILRALTAVCRPYGVGLHLRLGTRLLGVRTKLNSINARMSIVGVMNDSHVLGMCGHCCRQEKDVRASGQTASQCCAARWR